MEIDYAAIGRRVRRCRKSLKLTQAQLAEKAGLSDTNISHIERGKTKLSLPSLIAIANALETNSDYLLMDVIDNTEIQFRNEFASLVKDCTKEEYRLCYNICKSALDTVRKSK